MVFHIITIFPDIFTSYFNEGILKRAQKKGIIKINIINLRDYTIDKHRTIDDKPYGGGAGMIMRIEPIYKALSDLKLKSKKTKRRVILLTPAGKTFNQGMAKKLSKNDELVFICGRYEGLDARVERFVDEKISIGDYVLTGGELGAMAIIDSVTRLLPGALGNIESIKEESHSDEDILEYPQYTRPEVFEANGKKLKVPKVLLSGHHKKIEKWRISQKQKRKKTKK